jgi:hypothetical protein
MGVDLTKNVYAICYKILHVKKDDNESIKYLKKNYVIKKSFPPTSGDSTFGPGP